MTAGTDLGSGFSFRWFGWKPDRTLNPQYDSLPDVERAGIILRCAHGTEGVVNFDLQTELNQVVHKREVVHKGEVVHKVMPVWTVESLEPLTLSPSLDCGECGCHGYIREGKWVSA